MKGIPAKHLKGALILGDNYLIPKVLIHSDRYKNLQTDAAVLYAVLFDKSIVSDDEDGVLIGDDGRKLFITNPVSEIIAGLDFVDKRAEILLRELDSEGLIKVVGQVGGNPPGIIVFPVCEGIDRPACEGVDRPACEGIERREVSSVKLRYIGAPVVAESCEIESCETESCETISCETESCETVTDPAFASAEPESVYSQAAPEPLYAQAEPEPVYSQAESEPEIMSNDHIPLHEHQTPLSDFSDKAGFAPHPVSNRIIALQNACNNEFSPSVVRELWISMQDVIDEARWDDLDFLSGWLNSLYVEMHSRVAGGDKFVRIALLQDLISGK